MKTTKKAVLKRNRILSAAAKVFAAKGYSETTLADIASEAGTFAGSLYYYFASKEAIVEEVLNIGTTSVANLVTGKVSMLPSSVSSYDKIRVALETHLEQMLLRDEFVVAYWKIIDQVPAEIREHHMVLPRAYGKFWQRMLTEAQAAGEIRPDLDPSLLRLLLIGSTIYALDWFRPDGRRTPTQIADVLTEMFFFGSVPRRDRPHDSSRLSSLLAKKPRPADPVGRRKPTAMKQPNNPTKRAAVRKRPRAEEEATAG
jgi:AcrR family transcriptional regulator